MNYAIGRDAVISLKGKPKQKLLVKIWVRENWLQASTLQYVSGRFEAYYQQLIADEKIAYENRSIKKIVRAKHPKNQGNQLVNPDELFQLDFSIIKDDDILEFQQLSHFKTLKD